MSMALELGCPRLGAICRVSCGMSLIVHHKELHSRSPIVPNQVVFSIWSPCTKRVPLQKKGWKNSVVGQVQDSSHVPERKFST
eukprot:scaffold189306_cov21-Tisochrysis_lutea.AAC.1